jgi:exodeoxyribonuclease VIII
MIKRHIPMDEYRKMDGLSKHELDSFSVAPAYYMFKKTQDWKPSRSMEMGTLIHSLILEGKKDYAVGPQVDRRTKDGKAEWQAFCEENIGKVIINDDEERTILGCRDACAPLIEQHIEADFQQNVETSMFWERNGVACTGRPDLIGDVNGEYSIIDLKTTNDIRSFDSKFFSFRYDVQASWYQYGLVRAMKLSKRPAFWFLVVDTEAPHLAQMMKASEELLDEASIKIEEEMAYFKRCQDRDVWPGLPDQKLILPREW